MSEDFIERMVASTTNAIDRRFMRGEWSQAQYDMIMADLARWAESALRSGRLATSGTGSGRIGLTPDAFAAARRQHLERVKRVTSVREELYDIAEAIA